MSHPKLTSTETQFLQEALSTDYKIANIRLREGEYQYDLAKAIASFHLELHFPDVKDIIKKLYGEGRASDIQFIRKIQTILKKMEKSNIVRILPKGKPWELQRYALSSFKFQDVDKNLIVLATDEQRAQMQNRLQSLLSQQIPLTKPINIKLQIFVFTFMVVASYILVLWSLIQPIINPVISVSAFSVAIACSLTLGKILAKR